MQYPGICLPELRNTTKNIRQESTVLAEIRIEYLQNKSRALELDQNLSLLDPSVCQFCDQRTRQLISYMLSKKWKPVMP
jgi:hypothetical protein